MYRLLAAAVRLPVLCTLKNIFKLSISMGATSK